MSRGSQIAIGIVAALLGVMVLASALMLQLINATSEDPSTRYVLLGLSGFAFCISNACFFGGSRAVTLRLIGIFLLAGGVMMLIGGRGNSDNTSYRAYFFAAALGAGGLWLAVTGSYPKWGAYGGILNIVKEENAERERKEPSNET